MEPKVTFSDQKIKALAQAFYQAEKTVEHMPPPSAENEEMTISDSYRIQDEWVNMMLADGRTIRGHKIGLTSVPMQKAFGIDEPDFGVLMTDMVHENTAKLDVTALLEPRIEVELAFQLEKDIDPEKLSHEDILNCVSSIHPAMEVIDFRINAQHTNGKSRTVKDTIADNAANCAMVYGTQEIPKTTDLAWVSAVLRKNGVIENSGVAAAVLDHPLNGIVWLAKRYAAVGRTLKAGQIILAGSFTSPIPIKAGDKFQAEFNGFGSVWAEF